MFLGLYFFFILLIMFVTENYQKNIQGSKKSFFPVRSVEEVKREGKKVVIKKERGGGDWGWDCLDEKVAETWVEKIKV